MSLAPSPELRGHVEAVDDPQVDARAFRQGWTVRTRLDGLLADRLITPGQWQAATEYRAAWGSIGSAFAASRSASSRVSSSAGRGISSTIGAVERVRAAEAAIGTLAASLCRACIVDDLSWRDLGRRLHVRDVTAKAWAVPAIRGLALAWGRSRR